MNTYRLRRLVVVLVLLASIGAALARVPVSDVIPQPNASVTKVAEGKILDQLLVKGRAPKTGYSRSQFGDGWASSLGCDTRNRILARDLRDTTIGQDCKVQKGTLSDPYTGKTIMFVRGELSSSAVQIDHVVALSDAWQTGAQQLPYDQRISLANDPLNLLAVDGPSNQQKSDGDAATWLPPNKSFRCQYVQRQVDVKQKYHLWVTQPEKDAIARVLAACS